MIKTARVVAAAAGFALIGTAGMANAASMEDYEQAKQEAQAAIEAVEEKGYAAWSPHPKSPLFGEADKLAKKGEYEKAIEKAEYIKELQALAEKQWAEQDAGPYKSW
ncbi:hypothetical protein GM160_05160 [Guyparkeria halophila]|uniref:SoxXA-binding protein n=1 Tax=Guyparkeria halophila TaxID=47960 RepID=A0A6I6D433_9GAMM|nr:hypothetical protein [Guyparkeria halophila]QGT78334.1 hypothetical protein GM160_05160 [Guyparkeria halophila]